MRKRLTRPVVVVLSVIVAISALVGISVYQPGNVTQPEPTSDVLCQPVVPPDIDFTALNDVYQIILSNSVYQSKATDPALLLKGAMKTIFGFVGVKESDIPQEYVAMVDQQIAAGRVDFGVIQQVYDKLSNDPRYSVLNNPERKEDIFESAVNGIIKALGDPFAAYTRAEAYKSGVSDSSGKYEGIGVSTREENNDIIVGTVFSGSPAEKAGMKAGDVILKVDGKSIYGCSTHALTQKIRGQAGTVVVITVRHLNGKLEDLPITRGQIRQNVVSSCPGADLPDGRGNSTRDLPLDCPLVDRDGNFVQGILYIKMNEFTEQVPKDFGAILQSVPRQNYARGIIIDLRGNPGGMIKSLEETLDYFMGPDDVMMIQENASGLQIRMTYDRFDLARGVPVVLLVGRDPQQKPGSADNSYSASEVFAGAMRDNHLAVIVGESATGGKGTINTTFPIRKGEYGALYLAIGLWKTPSGEFIERIDTDGDGYKETGGLTPDVLVEWTDEDYVKFSRNPLWDPVLYKAIDILYGN